MTPEDLNELIEEAREQCDRVNKSYDGSERMWDSVELAYFWLQQRPRKELATLAEKHSDAG